MFILLLMALKCKSKSNVVFGNKMITAVYRKWTNTLNTYFGHANNSVISICNGHSISRFISIKGMKNNYLFTPCTM